MRDAYCTSAQVTVFQMAGSYLAQPLLEALIEAAENETKAAAMKDLKVGVAMVQQQLNCLSQP